MDGEFMFTVDYKEKHLAFPARIIQFGYTIRLEVEVEGTNLIFEPDEERSWRAVMGFEDLIAGKKIDKELVEAIIQFISESTK